MVLPIIFIQAKTLPEAWEKSIVELWERGIVSLKESYRLGRDREIIKEALAIIVVDEPLAEPRVHAGYLGVLSLPRYVEEVLTGLHDYLVGKTLSYTYHHRYTQYFNVNQFELAIEKLRECNFSNRVYLSTWDPRVDIHSEAPPCNVGVWLKVVNNRLVMVTTWRSRDAFHAAFANMFAFTELQRVLAERLGVGVGPYIDISFSYHIYEYDFEEVQRFLNTLKKKRERGEKIYMTTQEMMKLVQKHEKLKTTV